VKLESMQQSLPASAEIRGAIAQVNKEIEDLGSDIQTLSHRLHSSKLEYLGLAQSAAGLCRELSGRQGREIVFRSENIPNDLPQEISLTLFRVLQEALQNAIKHSGSRDLRVSLTGRSNQVELTVSDSGVGFDPEVAMHGRGLGLTSIKERLRLVNGDLSIDSQRRGGTTIRARVPVGYTLKSAGAKG